jgi:hypothetical protein
MVGRIDSEKHLARTSVSRVGGLLRHHPDTAMMAILALSYPMSPVSARHIVVGPIVDGDDKALRVAVEWEIGPEGSSRVSFYGELRVTQVGENACLELTGEGRGSQVDAASIRSVLSWLALAAEAGTSPADS